MSKLSRAYIKRLYRVPRDRGASECLCALVTKALVKHGWPATGQPLGAYAFQIDYHKDKGEPGSDFWEAVSIAVRVTARAHRLVVLEYAGRVELEREYAVTQSGFKELKP